WLNSMVKRLACNRIVLALALGTAAALPVQAMELPLEGVPVPTDRPGPSARIDSQITTATIPVAPAGKQARLAVGGDISILKSGLGALASGDIAAARRHRDRLPAN